MVYVVTIVPRIYFTHLLVLAANEFLSFLVESYLILDSLIPFPIFINGIWFIIFVLFRAWLCLDSLEWNWKNWLALFSLRLILKYHRNIWHSSWLSWGNFCFYYWSCILSFGFAQRSAWCYKLYPVIKVGALILLYNQIYFRL